MRCSSYCTAKNYNLTSDISNFNKLGYKYELIDKVVVLRTLSKASGKNIDIFLFEFGSCIIWQATEVEELEILKNLEFLQLNSLTEWHSEFINFDFNADSDRTYIDEEKNIIYLADDTPLIKLSISHALAQGIKLKELEKSVTKLLEDTKPLQKELSQRGYVSLSKAQISKQLGVLFSAKYSVNMHSDILDTPEFFWRRPNYEPIYLMTVEFQDIKIRQDVLNNHLNLIQELYSMLSSDLDHKHSSRLEVIIILLIAIEIFLALYSHNFFHNLLSWLF